MATPSGRAAQGGDKVMATGLVARARAAMVGRTGRRAWAALAATTLVTTVLVMAPASATSGAGTLQLSQPEFAMGESGGPLVLTVDRVGGSTGAVSASYSVTPSTATAGVDYTAVSGTVSWADGETTSQTISVPLLDDELDEGAELFVVRIQSPTGGAVLGAQSHAIGVIDDDDTSHTITTANANGPVTAMEGHDIVVQLGFGGNADGNVTLPYSVTSATATAGEDFDGNGGMATFADGSNYAEVHIETYTDDVDEGPEAFLIHFGTASDGSVVDYSGDVAAIIGDPVAPAGTFTFDDPVTELTEGGFGGASVPSRHDGVKGAAEATAVLGDITTDGTSDLDVGQFSSTTISGNDGADGVSSVLLTSPDDGVDEGDELATVTLTNPTLGATIGSSPEQIVVVHDAQRPMDGIQFMQLSDTSHGAEAPVVEGGTAHLPVFGPAGTSVSYVMTDLTATGGADYVVGSGTVQLDGVSPSTIDVATKQDTAAEPTEFFAVRLTSPDGADLARSDTMVVAITDDDTAARLHLDLGLQLDEGVDTSVTLTPSHARSTTTSVDYEVVPLVAGAADFDGAVPSGTLTWSPGDDAPKSFTITPKADGVAEPYELFAVVLHDPVGVVLPEHGYDAVRPPGQPWTLDYAYVTGSGTDDAGGIQFSGFDCDGFGFDRLFPEGSNAEITVSRTSGVGAASVAYTTVDASATHPGDYTSTSGTLSWDDNDVSPKCISVPIAADALDEGQEAVGVVLSNATGDALVDPATFFSITDGAPGGVVHLTTAGPTDVTEGAGSVTVDVVRAGGSDGAASVHVTSADGTATAGDDYTAIDETVSWSDGETGAKSVTLTVAQDSDDEANENLTVSLSDAVGAVLGAPTTESFRILDDDGANQAPVVDAGGPYTVVEGSTVGLDGTGTDPEGGAVTYSWTPTANLDDASLADPTFSGVDDDVVTETLEVCDASSACNSDTATVTVTNATPIVTADDQASDSSGGVDGDVATFTDAGTNDTHTATIDWGAGGGPEAASLDEGTATVSGTHTFASDGPHDIEVCVTDDDGDQGCDTATITVSGAGGGGGTNTAPDAVDDSATITEGTASTTISVLDNDTDADFDPLQITDADASSAHGGTVDCSSGSSCDYSPPAGYTGTDTFHYTVSDGNGGTDTALVTITISACPNLEPAIDDGGVATGQHWVTCSSLTANGTGPSPTPLLTATGPTVGIMTSGDVANVPGPNDDTGKSTGNGVPTVRGAYDVSILRVDLDVPAGAQCLSFDFVFGSEEYPEWVGSFNDAFLAELDTDDWSVAGDEITAPHNIAFDGAGNVVSVNSAFFDDGRVVTENGMQYDGATPLLTARTPITPGTHALYLSIFDAGDQALDSGVIVDALRTSTTPCAAGVNQAPSAVDDTSITTAEDTAKDVAVLANDTDPDGDTLTVMAVSDPPHGTASVNSNGTVHYVPDADYHGTDSFTYTISDGHGGTDTATVSLTVTSVNDPPDAVNDTSVSTNEDTAKDVAVLGNDTDVDGDTLTVTAVSDPPHGTASINSNGTVHYVPDANYHGTDSFTYTISDGHGGTDTATVSLTVTSVNDAPDAVDDAGVTTPQGTAKDVAVLGNDTDVDGDTLTVTAVSDPPHGTTSINGNGTVHYVPDPGYSGSDSFTYTISDGHGGTDTATVSITVTTVNHAPVLQQPGATTMLENVTADVNLSASDTDGGKLTFSLGSTAPKWATISTTGTPHVHLAPGYDAAGDYTFTVTVTDPTNLTDSKQMTVHVIDVAPLVSIADSSVKETDSGTVAMTFSLKLDRKDPSARIVNVTTNPATASEGVDYVDLTAPVSFAANATTATATVTVRGDLLKEPTETFTLDVVTGGTTNVGLADGSGAGSILDNADVCTIVGTSGDDTLNGTSGADYICALAGDDVVNGFGGNDTILAGAGNDTVSGGAGADTIDAGDGIDSVQGGDGADVIDGGAGNDGNNPTGVDGFLNGSAGNDTIHGGAGNDDISGGDDGDELHGDDGADVMNGNGGNDVMYGGDGGDLMEGASGNDDLYGQKGNDELHGGLGVNHLDGGPGDDTCSAGPAGETQKSCTIV